MVNVYKNIIIFIPCPLDKIRAQVYDEAKVN